MSAIVTFMGRRLMRRLPDQLLAAALMLFCAARACAGGIEPARDLRADAKASGRDGMPLIVFFSSYSCPYCEQVATLHLEPLIEHGSTVGAVRVREVEIASGKTLRDFAGARMTHAEFADRENVSVTPVVKFFGPDGAEIASPLVGYSNADFYGDYLDASLRAARSTGWGQRRDSAPIR